MVCLFELFDFRVKNINLEIHSRTYYLLIRHSSCTLGFLLQNNRLSTTKMVTDKGKTWPEKTCFLIYMPHTPSNKLVQIIMYVVKWYEDSNTLRHLYIYMYVYTFIPYTLWEKLRWKTILLSLTTRHEYQRTGTICLSTLKLCSTVFTKNSYELKLLILQLRQYIAHDLNNPVQCE